MSHLDASGVMRIRDDGNGDILPDKFQIPTIGDNNGLTGLYFLFKRVRENNFRPEEPTGIY